MLSLSTIMALTTGDSPASAPPQALAFETGAMRAQVSALTSAMLKLPCAHPDVEDCTHETLRRALEGRSTMRGESVRGWVLGIARHVALDAIRARQRERRRTADGVDTLQAPGEGLEDRLAASERHERMGRVIAKLPDGQREALLLFHNEGLGYQQIASRMGVPLGTVATWLTRARQSVAAAMDGEGS